MIYCELRTERMQEELNFKRAPSIGEILSQKIDLPINELHGLYGQHSGDDVISVVLAPSDRHEPLA